MKLFTGGVSLGTGIAIGIGAALLVPVVIPVVAGVVRPLTKAIIKGGLIAFDKTKSTLAEAKEVLEDITAEAKEELTREGKQVVAVAPVQGSSDYAS